MKRENVITWDECFMTLAETVAKRSKDPFTQVGACIINPKDNRIISLGYNGFPYGCSDDVFPWAREGEDNKYLYVVHAELNAILSAKTSLNGCTLYVTHKPCNNCVKAIIQSGIKTIIYNHEYKDNSMIDVSGTKMLEAAGLEVRRYESSSIKEDDNIKVDVENVLRNEINSQATLLLNKTNELLNKFCKDISLDDRCNFLQHIEESIFESYNINYPGYEDLINDISEEYRIGINIKSMKKCIEESKEEDNISSKDEITFNMIKKEILSQINQYVSIAKDYISSNDDVNDVLKMIDIIYDNAKKLYPKYTDEIKKLYSMSIIKLGKYVIYNGKVYKGNKLSSFDSIVKDVLNAPYTREEPKNISNNYGINFIKDFLNF